MVPGLISTVIFALPAPIRLTHLGISSVPKPLIEAGEAFGATPLQLLWKVELPSAAGTIVAGITQCIMLSLSMVVIAALVGAGGLGVPVVRALNSVQDRAKKLLAGVPSVTHPATANGRQIFRARFAGFDAGRAASTCTELRRKGVDCFVMAGQ